MKDYLVEIVDKPNETINDSEKKILVDQCCIVARKGFGNDGITESDVETHVLNANTGVFVKDKKSGEVVAFGSSDATELDGKKVLHLKGTAVLPEHQREGLYKIILPARLLMESVKLQSQDFYIGSRTQNPIVVHMMTNKFGMQPKIGEEADEDIKQLAQTYAKWVQDKHSDFRPSFGFRMDDFIVRKAYANSMGTLYNVPKYFDLNKVKSEIEKKKKDSEGFHGEVLRENDEIIFKQFSLKEMTHLLKTVPGDYHPMLKFEELGFSMYGPQLKEVDDKTINNFMNNELDVQKGDALIMLGKLNVDKAFKSLDELAQKQGSEVNKVKDYFLQNK